MADNNDLARVLEQEKALVFDQFDEDIAIEVVRHVREAARGKDRGVGILVKFWDRLLAFGATKGYSHHNYLWAHRKANTVRLVHKPSYRLVLERGDKPRLFDDSWAVDPAEYAISGGAFPINVKGAGIVGVACVSGLHERDDHELVVAAFCAVLGLDAAKLALPARS